MYCWLLQNYVDIENLPLGDSSSVLLNTSIALCTASCLESASETNLKKQYLNSLFMIKLWVWINETRCTTEISNFVLVLTRGWGRRWGTGSRFQYNIRLNINDAKKKSVPAKGVVGVKIRWTSSFTGGTVQLESKQSFSNSWPKVFT